MQEMRVMHVIQVMQGMQVIRAMKVMIVMKVMPSNASKLFKSINATNGSRLSVDFRSINCEHKCSGVRFFIGKNAHLWSPPTSTVLNNNMNIFI